MADRELPRVGVRVLTFVDLGALRLLAIILAIGYVIGTRGAMFLLAVAFGVVYVLLASVESWLWRRMRGPA